MPPRKGKEPKEQVVYAASKSRTPAYKPLRPSKVARVSSTTESGTSQCPKAKPAIVKKATAAKPPPASNARRPITLPDSEDDEIGDLADLTRDAPAAEHSDEEKGAEDEGDDDDDEGDDDDLPTLSALKAAATTKKKKRKASSAMSINDDRTRPTVVDADPDPPPYSDGIPGIPQPLLLRLLHEGFTKRDTRIDMHALQIVQTYVEVFVREAIARCLAEKKEAAERGEVGEGDVGWLELEDLEKVGVGMLLDF